jgi:hypothetical protein
MPFCTICSGDTVNITHQLDISDGYTWYCESCDTWEPSIDELDEQLALGMEKYYAAVEFEAEQKNYALFGSRGIGYNPIESIDNMPADMHGAAE